MRRKKSSGASNTLKALATIVNSKAATTIAPEATRVAISGPAGVTRATWPTAPKANETASMQKNGASRSLTQARRWRASGWSACLVWPVADGWPWRFSRRPLAADARAFGAAPVWLGPL